MITARLDQKAFIMTGDLIQDIDNAIRQERTERLWREYGPYIIGGAVLAVIITGGLSGWQAWKAKQAQRDTAQVMMAMEAKDAPAKAAALDKAVPDLHPGPRAVASFTAAGLLISQGKNEDALKHYEAAAKDASLPAVYRDLATWLAVRLDWSLHKANAQNLLSRLGPLIQDNNNPWTLHARLEAAQIAAHGLKDLGMARDYLAPVLKAEKTPPSLKQRAQALDHVYQLQQGNTVAQPAKEEQAG